MEILLYILGFIIVVAAGLVISRLQTEVERLERHVDAVRSDIYVLYDRFETYTHHYGEYVSYSPVKTPDKYEVLEAYKEDKH